MKIGIGLIFYDDVESLKHCIPTLKADSIYAVDGRFKNFKSEYPLSTDGSREYLNSINNVELIDAPNLSEVDKRNVYLNACKEDFLIVVDSDHWVEGQWEEFNKEIEKKVNKKNGYGYWFLIEDRARKTIHYQCLGFYRPNHVMYKYRHDWYEAEQERIIPYSHNGKYTELHSLKMYNDPSLRTTTRIKLAKSWYEHSRKMELQKTSIEKSLKFTEKLKRKLKKYSNFHFRKF